MSALWQAVSNLREALGPGGYNRADILLVCDAVEKLHRSESELLAENDALRFANNHLSHEVLRLRHLIGSMRGVGVDGYFGDPTDPPYCCDCGPGGHDPKVCPTDALNREIHRIRLDK